MSNVFVTQEPLMRAPATGDIVRKMDLTPAKEFGELIYLIDWSSLKNGIDCDKIYWEIRNKLENEQFNEGDFLLLIGHPIAMAMTFRVATELSTLVQMLDWDRHKGIYNIVEFNRGK